MFDQFINEGIDSTFSKDNINIWAREAVSLYLDKGSPMVEKIAEIADCNGLNPEQIQRIVEAANLLVDSIKKGSDFQVARAPDVMAKLKGSFPEENPMDLSDYITPPEAKDSDLDLHELFGIKPQGSAAIPQKKVIQIKIIKLASAKKALEDYLTNLEDNKKQNEVELVKVAKQAVLGDHEDVNELYGMVCEAGYEKLAKTYFPVINHVLVGQGIIEKTAFRAPEELISKDLDDNGIPSIKIVNGNHAVIKTFQTMQKIDDDIVHARKAVIFCDGKLNKYKEEAKRVS